MSDTETILREAISTAEYEAEVIGAMLSGRQNPSRIEPVDVFRVLPNPQMFSDTRHQMIYAAMIEVLNVRFEPIELTTIRAVLEGNGNLALAGGTVYLETLREDHQHSITMRRAIKQVRDRYVRRKIMSVSANMAALAKDLTRDTNDTVSFAQQEVQSLLDTHYGDSVIQIKDMTSDLQAMMQDFRTGNAKNHMIPTGLSDVDKHLIGFARGQMVVIGGRTAEGKTSLAVQIAQQAAIQGKRVLIFSLEMLPIELLFRMVCAESRIDSYRIKNGETLTDGEYTKLTQAIIKLEQLPIYFDAGYDKSIPGMRSKIQRLQAKEALGLVMVDYLGLITPHKRGDNRAVEVAYISRDIKRMALEFNVPVLAVAQLSRAIGSRTDKIPVLSDLKDSSAIEQDADIVMFIDRKGDSETESVLYIRKNRNGACGQIPLFYNRTLTRFELSATRSS